MSIALVGLNGYSGRWSLPSYKCISENVPDDESLSYFNCDFVHKENQSDSHLMVVAGS